MVNQAFNLLGTILILAMVSVALSRKSNTEGVLKSFFGGFAGSIRAAKA